MNILNFIITFGKVFSDIIAIILAFSISYFLRVADYTELPKIKFFLSSDFPFREYFVPVLIILPLWILVMFFVRGYGLEIRIKSFRHIMRIIFVVIVGIAGYLITFFFMRKFLFSRLIVVMILGFSISFIFINHLIWSSLAKHYYAKGKGTFRTLIIGTTREAQRLVKYLIKEKSIHQPVAILDGYGTKLKEIEGVPVLGKLNIFDKTVHDQKIDQIIQTDNLEQTINIINFALQHNLKYAMLPTLLGIHKRESRVEALEGIAVVRVL